MKRRSFLSLLATGPVAAPVAAQEAARKMGLVGLGSLGGLQSIERNVGTADCVPKPIAEKEWTLTRWSQFWSDEERNYRILRAKDEARILDPDLASMRSVSPCGAYSIQRDRVLNRIERSELSWFERQSRALGLNLIREYKK